MIAHSDFVEAIRPLLTLAGTDPDAIFADGFEVTPSTIRFISATPVDGVAPITLGADVESSAQGWPVEVAIECPSSTLPAKG